MVKLQTILIFTPTLGDDPLLTDIFQMGWGTNHQVEEKNLQQVPNVLLTPNSLKSQHAKIIKQFYLKWRLHPKLCGYGEVSPPPRPQPKKTLPETNRWHLKIASCDFGDSYWKPSFLGAMYCYVSFRECKVQNPSIFGT